MGKPELAQTLPVTTKKWTDNGSRHDERGLKQRDPDAVRPVPIPPQLVGILRAHIREFGTAADSRLVTGSRDELPWNDHCGCARPQQNEANSM
jgi:hypothetical protein